MFFIAIYTLYLYSLYVANWAHEFSWPIGFNESTTPHTIILLDRQCGRAAELIRTDNVVLLAHAQSIIGSINEAVNDIMPIVGLLFCYYCRCLEIKYYI